MQLTGDGMLGLNAVAYGLVELELEAGDCGLRSFVSVQSALAMFAILTFGSDEQSAEWLPRMTSGEAIGCFGLSASRTRAATRARCARSPGATATTGC